MDLIASPGNLVKLAAVIFIPCMDDRKDEFKTCMSGRWSGWRNTRMLGCSCSRQCFVCADETVMGGLISGFVSSRISNDLKVTSSPNRVKDEETRSTERGRSECI